MNLAIYIYIALYLVALGFYFYSRTSNSFKKHSINKLILSSAFMIFTVIAHVLNGVFFNYHLIGVIATIIAFIADIVFLFSFNRGGITFMCCNILFFVYEILLITNNNISFSKIWWSILIFIALYSTYLTLVITKKIKLGTYKMPFSIYLASVSIHGTLAISLIGAFYQTHKIFLPIGLLLFMISDYLILIYKFVLNNNKWIIRANSVTYFIGLLLVSLSFI